jgi:hypothetical protein
MMWTFWWFFLGAGSGTVTPAVQYPVRVTDYSGARYGITDRSVARYGVTDESAPRYGVEVRDAT